MSALLGAKLALKTTFVESKPIRHLNRVLYLFTIPKFLGILQLQSIPGLFTFLSGSVMSTCSQIFAFPAMAYITYLNPDTMRKNDLPLPKRPFMCLINVALNVIRKGIL